MWDAKLYEEKHAFVWQQGASLIELLAPAQGESVLDIGCGTGHLAARIAATGIHVTGLDNSPEMVEQARRNYPALRFEIADARQLAFSNQFDGVFSNAALHWIPEAESVVKVVVRALKTGGRFVAEFGGRGNIQSIQTAMHNAVKAIKGQAPPSPWFFPTLNEYASLLEKAGLELRFAILFDRPTALDGEAGMRNWVTMFGGHCLREIPAEQQESFFRLVEAELRPVLRQDDAWFADYRRLRVVAFKAGHGRP
jgi:trans-aconitate 2-methyltransferase